MLITYRRLLFRDRTRRHYGCATRDNSQIAVQYCNRSAAIVQSARNYHVFIKGKSNLLKGSSNTRSEGLKQLKAIALVQIRKVSGDGTPVVLIKRQRKTWRRRADVASARYAAAGAD